MDIDVLIAPHHGSKTSSTASFIAATSPQYVLFPVGYGNRYGFPKPAIVKRYQEFKVKQYTTAQSGAINISTDGKGLIKFNEYRITSGRFWYR